MTDEIKPFAISDAPKSGLFRRMLGRISREAAFVQIRNLLASVPFDQVSVSDVEGVLSRAKLDSRDVVSELTAVFQHAALLLAVDRDLTDSDRASLDNLQRAFQLTDDEARAARDAATGQIFERTMREALADGLWSPDDQVSLDATAKALGISDARARALYEKAAVAAVRRSFGVAVADRRLGVTEEARVQALAASLDVDMKFDKETAALAERFRQLARIEDGTLPTVAVRIMLQRGEHCHFVATGLTHKEMRVVTQRVNYSGPVASIKIMKGVRWRVGSVAVQRVTQDVLTDIDKVDAYFTSKRVFLEGVRKNTSIALGKVMHFTVFSDGMQIQKATGKDVYLVGEGDWELAGACLEAAAGLAR